MNNTTQDTSEQWKYNLVTSIRITADLVCHNFRAEVIYPGQLSELRKRINSLVNATPNLADNEPIITDPDTITFTDALGVILSLLAMLSIEHIEGDLRQTDIPVEEVLPVIVEHLTHLEYLTNKEL